MVAVETLDDHYKRLEMEPPAMPLSHNGKPGGHFNVYPRQGICKKYSPFKRRDFFKMSFITGTGFLHFDERSVEIRRPALLLSSPKLSYSWEPISEQQTGYCCLFNDAFLDNHHRKDIINDSPLVRPGMNPLFFLDDKLLQQQIERYFCKMTAEMESDYTYKYDMILHCVYMVVHEAMKLQSDEAHVKHANAPARITAQFLELLERQFPIDSPSYALQLKTAQDFAANLSIHVNHLNRAVKEVTGKTTTDHIAERITSEARALLKHANWSVAEIAYSLGFEYPAYFNNFFKKHANITPGAFRAEVV
jgi:AraC-like DNA-binding protein